MRNQNQNKKYSIGFTLIELLVVIAILGLLASIVLVSLNSARDKAKSATAISNQRELQKGVELYNLDMGFYPPDVNRGWDPGLFKRLPYNKDLGNDCDTNSTDCPICTTCPADWINQVRTKWKGPYIQWPNLAPWGGKYDYNNWNATTTRYGCDVPPGIYIGTQRNYDDSNPLPIKEEQWMVNQGLDGDNCLNGESEMTLIRY
ncbi:MAG: prepilin-type N-terminal cleavage/methylation domain-containing protein [Candidatus Doudnabacteria bacterium]|jgi:prepilin-type N-terminal cleavage/methylation domain-containing protein